MPGQLQKRKPAPSAMPPAAFRATLRELGLSRAWLADKLGKNAHTVGKWASGESPVPQYAAFVLDLLASIREAEKKLHDLTEST